MFNGRRCFAQNLPCTCYRSDYYGKNKDECYYYDSCGYDVEISGDIVKTTMVKGIKIESLKELATKFRDCPSLFYGKTGLRIENFEIEKE